MRSSSRSRRDASSLDHLQRRKRSYSVDYEIIDEECLGLTEDALDRCNNAFDNIMQTRGAEDPYKTD